MWEAAGRRWTTLDVTSCIFAESRRRADAQVDGLGSDLPTVVTTPVGFPASARRALRQAAAAAGFAVRAFVPESTAALLPLQQRLRAHGIVTVVDWGGGTLDVSVLQRHGRTLRERATRPMPSGGDAIDRQLAEWVCARLDIAFLELTPRDQDYLLRTVERAKRALSEHGQAELDLTVEGRSASLAMPRAGLARLTAPTVDEAISVVKAAVRAAGLSPEGVGRFVFIGGSARLYGFGQAVQDDEAFAGRGEFPGEPDWLVADGAALLAQHGGRYLAAEGVGLLLADGGVHPLLEPGEAVEGLERTVRVGLVEDVRAAQIPVGSYPGVPDGDGWKGQPQRFRVARCLTVPTMGFADEGIDVSLWMSCNLTLHVRAVSFSRDEAVEWEWAPESLPLMYELPG